MAITVPHLKNVNVESIDYLAIDFSNAGDWFGTGEDTFGPGVADRIAVGDIWSGGGQDEADTTMQINLSALTIGRIEMEAADSTVKALSAAVWSAQKTLNKALERAEKHKITINDDGTAVISDDSTGNNETFSGDPRDEAFNRSQARALAKELEEEIKGAIVFAGIADASTKGLLDRIIDNVFTYSPSADQGALEQNGEAIAAALYDRDLAATNLEFWESAKPQPLPSDPGAVDEFFSGVGDFFEYLWDHPEQTGELLLHSTEAAAGIVLVLLGSGGAVGGVTVSATGVGAVVGVPATAASAGIVVSGLALAGYGAYEAAATVNQMNTSGGTSSSGSTGPKPPQKADDVLKHLDEHGGAPPKGYKGGKPYENAPKDANAEKLPDKTANGDAIKYKEYDVDPKVKGQGRNDERLVTGDDGSVYYTNDHYENFIKVR